MYFLLKKCFFYINRIRLNISRKHIRVGMGASVYRETSFLGYNTIEKNTVFKGRIGHDSYIGCDSYIFAVIGNYSSVGDRVHCVFAAHPSSVFVSTSPVFYSTAKQTGRTFVKEQKFEEILLHQDENVPVIIGNDVWIGSDVTFVGRIKIGDGAIVAAGAVVTNDIPPFTIVGGVPAKEIKKRFTDYDIEFLLDIRWWDQDISWIEKYREYFSDISLFKKVLKEKSNEKDLYAGN